MEKFILYHESRACDRTIPTLLDRYKKLLAERDDEQPRKMEDARTNHPPLSTLNKGMLYVGENNT